MDQIHQITGISKYQDRKRVGRGSSAGGGKTAGRGTKGQKARTGGSVPAYFEGGQTPWMMRLKKKKGFQPHNKQHYFVLNVGDLATFAPEGEFSVDRLMEVKRIEPTMRVKILGNGEVTRAYQVSTHFISKSAQAKIEAAGGSVQLLS